MEKLKKFTNIMTIGIFVIFLFGVMVMTVISEKHDYSFYENRNLAVFPKADQGKVLSGEYTAAVDTYLSDHAYGRTFFTTQNTRLDLDIIKRPVINDIVIADDYLLDFLHPDQDMGSEIEKSADTMAENLTGLADLTESYGGKYYYAAVPCQYAYFENKYPSYMYNREEYTDLSLKNLSDRLENTNVNFLDIGKLYDEEGHPDSYSSKVDNHYDIEGAYAAYLAIMERIVGDTGYDLDILREGDYTIEKLPNEYLGSRARMLFGIPRTDEKLGILNPNEPIAFTRKDYGGEVDPFVYAMPKTETEEVLYSLYMGGDISITEIDTDRPELPSILVYGDSFTNAVETILYYGFDEMHSLDLRHYHNMALSDYIEEFKPDIVLCIRDYEALLWSTYNGVGVGEITTGE